MKVGSKEREKLSDQSVRVLAGTALPGVMRRGEVYRCSGGLLEGLEAVETQYRCPPSTRSFGVPRADQGDGSPVGRDRGTAEELPDHDVPRLTIHQGQDAVAVESAHDRVPLQLTDPGVVLSARWPLRDRPLRLMRPRLS
jgi:hypothetical protein